MLFNSISFMVLVGVTFGIYYLPVCRRAQPAILLVASLVFYGYNQPILVLLLLTSIAVNAFTSWRTSRASLWGSRPKPLLTGQKKPGFGPVRG